MFTHAYMMSVALCPVGYLSYLPKACSLLAHWKGKLGIADLDTDAASYTKLL